MSQLLASGGQSIGASASVLPMNSQGRFPLVLTWFPYSLRDSQESLPAPQLEIITSSVFCSGKTENKTLALNISKSSIDRREEGCNVNKCLVGRCPSISPEVSIFRDAIQTYFEQVKYSAQKALTIQKQEKNHGTQGMRRKNGEGWGQKGRQKPNDTKPLDLSEELKIFWVWR